MNGAIDVHTTSCSTLGRLARDSRRELAAPVATDNACRSARETFNRLGPYASIPSGAPPTGQTGSSVSCSLHPADLLFGRGPARPSSPPSERQHAAVLAHPRPLLGAGTLPSVARSRGEGAGACGSSAEFPFLEVGGKVHGDTSTTRLAPYGRRPPRSTWRSSSTPRHGARRRSVRIQLMQSLGFPVETALFMTRVTTAA